MSDKEAKAALRRMIDAAKEIAAYCDGRNCEDCVFVAENGCTIATPFDGYPIWWLADLLEEDGNDV